MMSIKEIKTIVGGTVEVPTHETSLTKAIELQKIHRTNGNKAINAALAYERNLSDEIASFFVRKDTTGLKDLLKALVLDTSHFDFMGKIRAYSGIVGNVPEIDEQKRKEVVNLLYKVMNFRNFHAHGCLITKGEDVYLRYYRNGMKEQLLDNNYWKETEKTLNSLLPLLQEINTMLNKYLETAELEKSENQEE